MLIKHTLFKLFILHPIFILEKVFLNLTHQQLESLADPDRYQLHLQNNISEYKNMMAKTVAKVQVQS